MRGGSPAILCGQIRFWEEGRKCSRKCIYLISANSFVKCVREKILLPPNLICTASWAALSGIREKTGRFSPAGGAGGYPQSQPAHVRCRHSDTGAGGGSAAGLSGSVLEFPAADLREHKKPEQGERT